MKGRKLRLAALLLALLMLLAGCGIKGLTVPLSGGTTSVPKAESRSGAKEALPEEPTEPKAEAAEERVTEAPTRAPAESGPITDPQDIADYLFRYGKLPDSFITKKEAQALGWDSGLNYVSDVAPGKSIGGDKFGNYEGLLPKKKGVTYREADCNYTGGKRGPERIIYSSDGRVWYTNDHYETFTELKPSWEGGSQ